MASLPQQSGLKSPDSSGQTNSAEKQPGYMVQLDGLRAVAIFAVMVSHFCTGLPQPNPWGSWGVRLFFVLSGFLITGILLKCRDSATDWSQRKHALKQFYIRRSLRIFPLFYFTILAMALLNIESVRKTIWWHLTYASNFYFALRGSWDGPVSHLWSLAVEEQFYLLWPCLILFLPEKYLLRCVVVTILIAPLYRITGRFIGLNSLSQTILLFGCVDSLGLGALLALYHYKNAGAGKRVVRSWLYNILGALLVLAFWFLAIETRNFYASVAQTFVSSLYFAWLIHQAAIGFRGPIGFLLELKPLLFIGKISYGIYVYHNFMPKIIPLLCARLQLPYPSDPGLKFVLLSGSAILVSTVSWFLLEKPICNLKHRFAYSKS